MGLLHHVFIERRNAARAKFVQVVVMEEDIMDMLTAQQKLDDVISRPEVPVKGRYLSEFADHNRLVKSLVDKTVQYIKEDLQKVCHCPNRNRRI